MKEEKSSFDIDEAAMESFPASDPPAWTLGKAHSSEASQSSSANTTDEINRIKTLNQLVKQMTAELAELSHLINQRLTQIKK